MKKRLLSVLLCLAMAVELLPNVAFAAAATRSGTKDDPYMQRPVPIPTAFPMRMYVKR